MVVVEFAAQYAFDTHFVGKCEHWVFGSYGTAVPFALYEFFFWRVAEAYFNFGACQVVDECTCGDTVYGLSAFKWYESACNVYSVAQGYVE